MNKTQLDTATLKTKTFAIVVWSKIEMSIDFNKDVFLLFLSVILYWTPKANNQILLSFVVSTLNDVFWDTLYLTFGNEKSTLV